MADKEARVRLTLTSDQFLAKLRQAMKGSKDAASELAKAIEQTGNASENAGKKASSVGAAFAKSFAAVKSEVVGVGNQIKGLIGTAATLGGAFTVGAALKNTVALQSGFSELALRMELTSKETVRWQDLQKQAQAAAGATTRTTDEMRESMAKVYAGTGDGKFATESMTAIGTAATATGKNVTDLAEMAAIFHKKFGASAKDLPQFFERIAEKADSGGQSFESIKADLEDMAAVAQRAGVKGGEGLTFILETTKQLDAKLGAGKAAAGLKGIFETLENTPEKRQQVSNLLNAGNAEVQWGRSDGVRFSDKDDVFTKTKKVLTRYTDQGSIWDRNIGQRGGHTVSAFKDMFQGDSKRTMQELMNPFEVAFKKARSENKSIDEARKIGTEAFEANIKKLSESSATGAKLQKAAADKAKEPAAQLRTALDALQTAVAQPELVGAINDLAKALPDLVKAIAPYISWAAKNPLAAAGMAVGGKLAVTGGSSLAGSALQGVAQHFAGIGVQIGKEFATSATGGAVWNAMGSQTGKAIGVVAAALIAYQVGKLGLDKVINPDLDKKNAEALDSGQADSVIARGTAPGATPEQKMAAAKAAAAELAKMTDQDASASIFSDQGSIGKLGIAADSVFGKGNAAKDALAAQEERDNRRARLKAVLRDTDGAADDLVAGIDRAGDNVITQPKKGKPGQSAMLRQKVLTSVLADDAARRQQVGPSGADGGAAGGKDSAGAHKEAAASQKSAADINLDAARTNRDAARMNLEAARTGGAPGGGSNGVPKPGPTATGPGT